MTTYIPTLWTNDINNTTIVGIFQDKDEAIRALFQKIMEENYLDFERFLEDWGDLKDWGDDDDNTQTIQDDFIEIIYNDYKEFENYDDYTTENSITQNLNDAINESLYKRSGFGRTWGCEMEEQNTEPAIVMK